jgi:hypothetical protein
MGKSRRRMSAKPSVVRPRGSVDFVDARADVFANSRDLVARDRDRRPESPFSFPQFFQVLLTICRVILGEN